MWKAIGIGSFYVCLYETIDIRSQYLVLQSCLASSLLQCFSFESVCLCSSFLKHFLYLESVSVADNQ